MFAKVVVLLTALIWALGNSAEDANVDTGLYDYIARLKHKYHQRFQDTCMKYPFVKRHIELLENPPGKYLMFVVQEPGQLPSTTGGLGDRLSGLITATAYALRVNRTLLIVGESPFEDLFVPYYVPSSPSQPPGNFTYYQGWAWSNWQQKYVIDMHWERCVNPKKGHTACALDYDYFRDTTALKFYCNRTYLCRWIAERRLGLAEEIKNILGIDESTDLYEVAGCLLRLSIHPTELMWKSVTNLIKESNVNNIHFGHGHGHGNGHTHTKHSRRRRAMSVGENEKHIHQHHHHHHHRNQHEDQLLIGIHFRCGDSSFHQNLNTPPNPQCVYISNETWKGTAFRDDLTYDSPLDLAQCANDLAHAHREKGGGSDEVSITSITNNSLVSYFLDNNNNINKTHNHIVYIASDSLQSTQQIISKLSFKNILNQPTSCHVDEQHSKGCATSTLTQWFLLSLSDYIITQGIDSALPTAYIDNPELMNHLQQGLERPKSPISAFSRTAALYSLRGENLRFGAGCIGMNTTTIGHFTHGNWICNPHMFY
jgi:hypothetical protein